MYRKQLVAVIVLAVATMLAAVPAPAMEPGQYAAGSGAKLGRGW